jgi:hypothetical protein
MTGRSRWTGSNGGGSGDLNDGGAGAAGGSHVHGGGRTKGAHYSGPTLFADVRRTLGGSALAIGFMSAADGELHLNPPDYSLVAPGDRVLLVVSPQGGLTEM